MKTRRILSTILAIVFVLSTFTFSAVTVNAESYIYVDQLNGNDSYDGSEGSPVKTIEKAIDLAGEGGTVHVVGYYKLTQGTWPAISVTITGGGADFSSIEPPSNENHGESLKLGADITFKNILVMKNEKSGQIVTNGHTLTFGEGSKNEANIHVGPQGGGVVESQTFIIEEGAEVDGSVWFGGGYNENNPTVITGDLNIVVYGTLKDLKLAQDGWDSPHKQVYVGGNINVRVGPNGRIEGMNDHERYTEPKGALVFIVENGGQMVKPKVSKDTNYAFIKLLSGLANGTVDFSEKAGYHFDFDCEDGYIAVLNDGEDNYAYISSGDFTFSGSYLNNKNVTVSFTNAVQFTGKETELALSADTASNEWTVTSSDETVEVNAVIKDSDGNIIDKEVDPVGYFKKYTYYVTVAPKEGYVFPQDFKISKINDRAEYSKTNLRGYVTEDYQRTGNSITFKYTADYTADYEEGNVPAGLVKISYVAGADDAYICGEVPEAAYYDSFQDSFQTGSGDMFGRYGYSYSKFVDVETGTEYEFNENIALTGLTKITLSPIWEQVTIYEVNFSPENGMGNNSPVVISVIKGNSLTIPENTFSRPGYKFVNWVDDNGTEYVPGTTYSIDDLGATLGDSDNKIYLYAKWESNGLAGTIIYVDEESGSDSGDGTSDFPVKTIGDAFALLPSEAENATIVVVKKATLLGNLGSVMKSKGANNIKHITITGLDGAVIKITNDIVFGCATTIENVGIEVTKSGAYIATKGYETVIGPNLTNVGANRLNIVDGSNDGSKVYGVNTTILNNVKIGTYYLGGSGFSSVKVGVEGNVFLTVKGADIQTIDFSPREGVETAIEGHIVVNIHDSKIGKIQSRLEQCEVENFATIIFFNDASIPTIESSLKNNLLMRNNKVFVVDSGIGGVTTVTEPINYKGRAIATATDPAGKILVYNPTQEGAFTEYTGSKQINLKSVNEGINKVRFGDCIPYSEDLVATIGTPISGAHIGTVKIEDTNNKVTFVIESWDPDTELSGNKFKSDTLYTAKIRIVPTNGYYFESGISYTVIINGTPVEAKYSDGGALTAEYTFDSKTDKAPVLAQPITFDLGGATSSNEPASKDAELHSTITLPLLPADARRSMPGYKFNGWKEYVDGNETGKIYQQGAVYTVSKNAVIRFEADWVAKASVTLPSIIILYDLSVYAKDKGRNPQYASNDAPIVVDNAFANLNVEIGGTKSTKKVTFDNEKNITKIVSDGKASAIKIDNWSLNDSQARIGEYKYVTIVYYYETTNAVAEGGKGVLLIGDCALADGTKTKWLSKEVTSMNQVVANKWSSITFDLTDAVAEIMVKESIPKSAVYKQFHISPIGKLSCGELAGDTLYLKSMTFSKYAPEK